LRSTIDSNNRNGECHMAGSENDPSKASAKAHFDGQHIVLEEPLELTKGTRLVVTVLPAMREPAHGSPGILPNRFVALLFGAAHLMLVAQIFRQATNWPLGATLGLTTIGSLIIMAALSALGVKAFRNQNPRIRFTFSTVFLVSIPLSVYLAA